LPTDRFIDGPTEKWVRDNLPENLLKTAYQLRCDCADLAIILRHVWLAAHHRQAKEGEWSIGSAVGEARVEDIRDAIDQAKSWNLHELLNPYSNADGKPLKKFTDLEPLLHAGDVLVWDHEIRGSGHVQTIMDLERDGAGRITRMTALQGNQPVGEDLAKEMIAADEPVQAAKKPAERLKTPSVSNLRYAPGRRIEKAVVKLPAPADRDDERWGWHDKDGTFLVAAGPPAAAPRPSARTEKGKRQPRHVTDWLPSLRGADLENIDARFESMLLELRAALEGTQGATDGDASRLGHAAGDQLANLLAKSGDLQEGGSSFHRLQRMRAQIREVRRTTCVKGTEESDASEKTARRCSLSPFDALDQALVKAARGISTVDFARKRAGREDMVNVLLTGFDPFGLGKQPRPEDWNPSGAAVRRLDGQTVSVGTGVTAAVEGVVLPVSFEAFRAGLVESIVDRNRDADAILTVSLDARKLKPGDPVRLEQFAVGVHSGTGQPAEATPRGPGGRESPPIFEATADVAKIAADVGPSGDVQRPTVGTTITLEFSTASSAANALIALGEPAQTGGRVEVSSVGAVRQIAATMRSAGGSGGTRFSFTARGETFTARLVEGPGGAFLSNEVSFRVLRRLAQQERTDTPSFHTHVPPADVAGIPQEIKTDEEKSVRAKAVAKARDALETLVNTLKRLIAAVARRVSSSRPPPGKP
jgi:hypothetical protein